jgi:hypothetical protein
MRSQPLCRRATVPAAGKKGAGRLHYAPAIVT